MSDWAPLDNSSMFCFDIIFLVFVLVSQVICLGKNCPLGVPLNIILDAILEVCVGLGRMLNLIIFGTWPLLFSDTLISVFFFFFFFFQYKVLFKTDAEFCFVARHPIHTFMK